MKPGLLPLRDLDPAAAYRVTNLDSRQQQRLSGQLLAGPGLPVRIGSRPGSALLLVERE